MGNMEKNGEPTSLKTHRFTTPPRYGYEEIASDDSSADVSESILPYQAGPGWLKLYAIVLTISTAIFGAQSLYMWRQSTPKCLLPTVELGFETEWTLARATIEREQVTFTSAFRYNETSKAYCREHNLDQPQYVGLPKPEIDEAWQELLAGQYLVLSEQEAKQLDDPVAINGMYLAEVEVMHSLHCVNAIRKALHQDYYSQHDVHALPKDLQLIHVEHCLDQLRQTVQCASDLTPVPLRSYGEVPNTNLIGTPQVHTCRNWKTFRKWYTARGDTYGKLNSGGT